MNWVIALRIQDDVQETNTREYNVTDDFERVAKALAVSQDQLDSVAEVVLQNKRGLDLVTAEKGRLCLFLNEKCCFYVNQSEIVRDMAQQLREQIIKSRKILANSWGNWSNIWSWASWLLPLTGPPFTLCSAHVWPLYSQCS